MAYGQLFSAQLLVFVIRSFGLKNAKCKIVVALARFMPFYCQGLTTSAVRIRTVMGQCVQHSLSLSAELHRPRKTSSWNLPNFGDILQIPSLSTENISISLATRPLYKLKLASWPPSICLGSTRRATSTAPAWPIWRVMSHSGDNMSESKRVAANSSLFPSSTTIECSCLDRYR